jgi:hypothetical protein
MALTQTASHSSETSARDDTTAPERRERLRRAEAIVTGDQRLEGQLALMTPQRTGATQTSLRCRALLARCPAHETEFVTIAPATGDTISAKSIGNSANLTAPFSSYAATQADT